MTYIHLFISLKIPDNVARTALYAAQNRLGYPALRQLRRSEFWQLSFPDASPEQAREQAEAFVLKTFYFVNPNKHVWSLSVSEQPVEELTTLRSPFFADAGLLVCDRVDGKADSTRQALQAMSQNPRQPAAILRGVWWDLAFDSLNPEQIRQATEDLAISRSRTHGLFANPHYQTCRIFVS